jgi:hypothetical protein
MTENKTTTRTFTPGPWHQTDADIYGLYIEANGVPVACACDLDGKPVEVTEANARLIVAAPDLLKVVQRLDYFREGFIHREYEPRSSTVVELLDQARAAIAKALG